MPKESKEEVQKRILEAEKVVISSMLHRWKKEHGMDYAIFVWNGDENVFSRVRIGDVHAKDFVKPLEGALNEVKALEAEFKKTCAIVFGPRPCNYCGARGGTRDPNYHQVGYCCPACGSF